MTRFSLPVLLILLTTVQASLSAQSKRSFTVDSVSFAYRFTEGDSTIIHRAEKLDLSDSVSIMNLGTLRILDPQNHQSFEEFGPRSKKTVKELFFTNRVSQLFNEFRLLFSGRLRPIRVTGHNAVHVNTVYGEDDDVAEGMGIRFKYDGTVVGSFSEIPINQPFDIVLTNTTPHVMVLSVVFNYKTRSDTGYKTIILDSTAGDGSGIMNAPIILAPTETVTVPAPFHKVAGYFPYRLNVFGAGYCFIIKSDSQAANGISIYAADDNGEQQEVPVERYYFESKDE
ncbi:MAG: hypothetical protein K6A64_09305 [Bacteroidales bacterium]|nr:hypothetical protein [Bacteroidales bacterium]